MFHNLCSIKVDILELDLEVQVMSTSSATLEMYYLPTVKSVLGCQKCGYISLNFQNSNFKTCSLPTKY